MTDEQDVLNDHTYPKSDHPGRPLGLTLAIIASVLLFTILPLAQLGTSLLIQSRFYSIEDVTIPQGSNAADLEPFMSGGNFELPNAPQLFLQVALGIYFLVVAIFAWRGRPAWIRYLLFTSVLLLTAINVFLTLIPLLGQPSMDQGIDSSMALIQTLLCGQLALTILIPLYVVWYMNRAPARAFYRGYYLSESDNEANWNSKQEAI